MKTKKKPAFPVGTPDPTLPPDNGDLKKTLGRAYGPLGKVIDWLRSVQPDVAIEERFHAQTGWHLIYLLRKRRLFYLTPKPRDYRFAILLGDKAIARLKQGDCADRFAPLLQEARRYAEGTAFIFDRKTFDPTLVIALLAAKIAN